MEGEEAAAKDFDETKSDDQKPESTQSSSSSSPRRQNDLQLYPPMPQLNPAHILSVPGYQPGFVFPSLENLVEFRYDLIGCTQLLDNSHGFHGDTYTTFDFNSFPKVYTVFETISHYYTQPCCMYICGEWISSHIQVPVAQHVCISLDDGTKRYEEVIRMDMIRCPTNPYTNESTNQVLLTSIENRVVRGNQSKRPRFRDILRRSLMETMRMLSDATFELTVSRASGRSHTTDFMINNFFNESRQIPYELYLNPLITHIPQHIDIPLTGVRSKLCGLFYRPTLFNATLLLTHGETHLFETIAVSINGNERKINGVAYDSALAKVCLNADQSWGVALLDATSYADYGPSGWGMNVVSHNPRVPSSNHPFCNYTQNPACNRLLNPYYSTSFHPPIIQTALPLGHSHYFQQQQSQGYNAVVEAKKSDNEVTPSQSPRVKLGKESTMRLNPHARDFIPQNSFSTVICHPYPIHSGPESIVLSALQLESEEPIIISSTLPTSQLQPNELDAFGICTNSDSDLSMLAHGSMYVNPSESLCSIYDPDTTIEFRPSARYEWSEEYWNEERRGNRVQYGRGGQQQSRGRSGENDWRNRNYRWNRDDDNFRRGQFQDGGFWRGRGRGRSQYNRHYEPRGFRKENNDNDFKRRPRSNSSSSSSTTQLTYATAAKTNVEEEVKDKEQEKEEDKGSNRGRYNSKRSLPYKYSKQVQQQVQQVQQRNPPGISEFPPLCTKKVEVKKQVSKTKSLKQFRKYKDGCSHDEDNYLADVIPNVDKDKGDGLEGQQLEIDEPDDNELEELNKNIHSLVNGIDSLDLTGGGEPCE